jgi:molybdate transport system substrate-binding protein
MSVRWLAAAWLLSLAAVTHSAYAADVSVLTAGAFRPVLLALQPGYERQTGDHLHIGFGTAGELTRQIAGGAHFDVLIAPREALRAVAGEIQAASVLDVARVGIGVVVRQGAPVPDVSTPEALRQTLLAAPSIAMIDPTSGGSSGPAVLAMFATLGIADAVKGRLVLKQGGAVADLVADGHAAIGVHQISEILPVPGVVLAGALPEALQTYTTYTVALGAHPADAPAADALVAALHGPAVAAILKGRGMQSAADFSHGR